MSPKVQFAQYQPKERPVEETEDFDLTIKIGGDDTFVPMGIPSYGVGTENDILKFEVEVKEHFIDQLKIEVMREGTVVYTKEFTQTLPVGSYTIPWDGFDNNGVYDSSGFVDGTFKIKATGYLSGKQRTVDSEEITFEYDEVEWVDVKIDKNNKQVDVTLRVNLKDGGAKGLNRTGRIPQSDLVPNHSPITTNIRSFEDLEKLALEGINYHWGRNKGHQIAMYVEIKGERYEICMNAINTQENAMDDVDLIFNTNRKWMRSGNPGTVEGLISLIGNLISREAVCYNGGYILHSDGWGYRNLANEDIEFKFTTAHEIDHTILKAYGNTTYSYGHKGSVNVIFQNRKSSAPKYETLKEIDIMPYYPTDPPLSLYGSYVASEKDSISLIWLTKLNIK
ncbi:hypothetical protein [uncultured Marixanthomonas sp.]|uniref:hypothetical protein n=1 Tax=uncultured Marixanthomonas sp. TaxID=757245 RepID=UPI0030D6EC36|tara:strand:- start:176356 stop:177537 length:1182 start_codon:yes stop_codon:yes gene_type:complete